MIGPDGKPTDDKGSTFTTTTFGSPDGLLLTKDDLAEQKQKETDAEYADALNVNNIENARYEIELHDYNEALNAYNAAAAAAAAANTSPTTVTPEVSPDTSNAVPYGTGIIGFDRNPDPYIGVHYDNAADRYAQEMTEASGYDGFYGGDFGGGGGGGGDLSGVSGYCPAPWVPILLADGSTREAGVLEPGMQVWTQHEKTGEWGAFPITAISFDYASCWELKLTNGNDFVGTPNHRVLTDKGWEEIQNLKPGAKLVQPEGFGIVASAEETTPGAVVKITVHDAHTYVSSGFISHNAKELFARGGIATLPKSPGQKLLAAHRAGDMTTVHRMLRKVRR
jgi:hypothetical protein